MPKVDDTFTQLSTFVRRRARRRGVWQRRPRSVGYASLSPSLPLFLSPSLPHSLEPFARHSLLFHWSHYIATGAIILSMEPFYCRSWNHFRCAIPPRIRRCTPFFECKRATPPFWLGKELTLPTFWQDQEDADRMEVVRQIRALESVPVDRQVTSPTRIKRV